MGNERSGGRLAIGPGDADAAGFSKRQESDVYLRKNLQSGSARGFERRHIRRHSRRHHHRSGAGDSAQIVAPNVHCRTCLPERSGPGIVRGTRPGVRGIHRNAHLTEQQRCRHTALAQTNDRHFAAARLPLVEERHDTCRSHRTFRVESATSAHSKPRM
jgi:hypothetical protein